MSIRSASKKVAIRVGRAFGITDTSAHFSQIDKNLKALTEFEERSSNDFWTFAFPIIKYNYYNDIAKAIHPRLFEKYRSCNKGRDLVIVACGPTVDSYKPIPGAKHLAINRAFLIDDFSFDYIFIHDKIMLERYTDALKNYKADKFVAFATSHFNSEHFNAKSEDVSSIGAKRFLISDPAIPNTEGGQFDIIQPDITKGLVFDRGGGTVFSALQFALFTEPRTIYLVGCDCTKHGYFKKIEKDAKQNLLEKTEYLWHEAKYFIEQYYPNTEVVSVNPVKLKGLFKDLEQ